MPPFLYASAFIFTDSGRPLESRVQDGFGLNGDPMINQNVQTTAAPNSIARINRMAFTVSPHASLRGLGAPNFSPIHRSTPSFRRVHALPFPVCQSCHQLPSP